MNRFFPDAGRLYGAEFAADPHGVYQVLRDQHGTVAPVEIAPGIGAHLVLGYRAALEVLDDRSGNWSKDPRPWQATLPDTPAARGLMGMIGWRPNVLFSDGAAHRRYRQVVTDCLAMVPPYRLRALVMEICDSLIREFAVTGSADLVDQYAQQIPLRLFNRLFGRPDQDSAELIAALKGLLNATPETGEAANAAFGQYMSDLLHSKYQDPAQDLTSWIIQHPAALTPDEGLHTVILLLGAAFEPLLNLIVNAIARVVSDPRYHATISDGALTTYDALQEVLRDDPSMANYGPYFVLQPTDFHGTWIRPAELVLVSYAAANTEPVAGLDQGERSDGGAHLGFGAGPHRCPAADPALLIAGAAIDRILTLLPGMRLAAEPGALTWRPGPFHRALSALPVTFRPIRPDQPGDNPWNSRTNSTPSDATSQEKPRPCAHAATS
ncbi:cytochrome P450 [Streptomyces sp. NPDC059096]|uniref:cytochrome P450 n=1 Tax=Streptomyces sp. NPDC059096 TaxID=3346727 RepID=UPI0036803628